MKKNFTHNNPTCPSSQKLPFTTFFSVRLYMQVSLFEQQKLLLQSTNST